jgi:hypothetical protein
MLLFGLEGLFFLADDAMKPQLLFLGEDGGKIGNFDRFALWSDPSEPYFGGYFHFVEL